MLLLTVHVVLCNELNNKVVFYTNLRFGKSCVSSCLEYIYILTDNCNRNIAPNYLLFHCTEVFFNIHPE